MTRQEKRAIFSKSKDKILIEMVRCNSVLYDSNHERYRDNATKQTVWENISAAIDIPVEQAKRRWRHFRDHYMKKRRESPSVRRSRWEYMGQMDFLSFLFDEKKKADDETQPGADETQPVTDETQLVADETQLVADETQPQVDVKAENYVFVVPPGEQDSFSEPEDDEPAEKKARVDSPVEVPSSPVPDASGLLVSDVHSQYTLPEAQERSATHTFFEAMADVVARFPPALVAEARLKVCQLVNELDARALAEVGCPRCRDT